MQSGAIKKAVVIGSGIAGLASAIRLAVKGWQVEVFEQSARPGGKLSEYRWEGFRFDTGPSLFTLPELVDELFELCQEDPRQYFQYKPLDKSFRYFWQDGLMLDAWQNPQMFAHEVEQKTGVEAAKVTAYLNASQKLYALTSDVFLFNSFHKAANYLRKSYWKAFLQFYKLDAFVNMHVRNRKSFKNKYVVQLFDRYATYNGSSPYKTPATLKMISHLEHNLGAWFPKKGMYDIVKVLVALAEKQGVKFHYNSRVEEICLERKKVIGIRCQGELRSCDLVVSDVDVVNLYKHLLPKEPFPQKQLRLERSTSALIFHWAINKEFFKLDVHNILFSADYKHEFDCLFSQKTISNDPTVYIFISSKAVPEDAPEGCENWFVMINVPENTGQDWAALVRKARENIVQKINQLLDVNIEDYLLHEQITDPVRIEQMTASYGGALYGLSSNGMLAAFNRHPNFKSRYKGLFFVGGSIHPGGGIPLCLASAKIIDKEIPFLNKEKQ